MITNEELHIILECINENFSIAIKARELRDLGLLNKADDIIHQSSKLGELMWVHVWSHHLDKGFQSKNVLDRGEQVVVKSQHDRP